MADKHLKLLVFDWDGTLADTTAHITAAMQSAICDRGLEVRSDDEIRNIIGLGLVEAAAILFPGMKQQDQQVLANCYRRQYMQTSNGTTPLFPGIRETLYYLHDQDYLMAIASGKSRRGLDRSLQETGLDGLFHASRCADETYSKPHPQMLQEIMDILNVEPYRTLMIGDSEYDLQMASNAGVDAVAVSYGAQSIGRLLQCNPLACLNKLSELQDWLARQY